jgi:hypothetical protein
VPLRLLGATWAWLAQLPLVHSSALPVDAGSSTSVRSPDPASPPGPGDRAPSSGVLDPAPVAFYGLAAGLSAGPGSRRPLPEPLGEERPGHCDRVDRPPRLAA